MRRGSWLKDARVWRVTFRIVCGKPGKIQRRNNPPQVRLELLQAAGRAHLEQRAHEQAEVVRCGGDQVAFADVLDSRQPGSPGASRLADMSEGSFGALVNPVIFKPS